MNAYGSRAKLTTLTTLKLTLRETHCIHLRKVISFFWPWQKILIRLVIYFTPAHSPFRYKSTSWGSVRLLRIFRLCATTKLKMENFMESSKKYHFIPNKHIKQSTERSVLLNPTAGDRTYMHYIRELSVRIILIRIWYLIDKFWHTSMKIDANHSSNQV